MIGFKSKDDHLFFSVPKEPDKLPFIGVIHSSYDPYKLIKDFLSEYEDKELCVYYSRNRITLRVQMSNRNIVQFYSLLTYDRKEFLVWLDTVKDAEKINFGLLKKVGNKMEMLKLPKTGQQFYFPLKKIFVFDFKDKTALRIIR